MGSYRVKKVYIPYRSLIEALYTLNSPPVVSFNWGDRYVDKFVLALCLVGSQ